ncbi:multidrug effflux MFS transporter [Pseudaestuariivita atlantica]|uniref:Bcr/CflA family efflux transporter n=1 Tax=Pseudaestuariivita atlantica TaxID=1317121 RepID=A0A0L1JRV9_9RHOB|nr:multidrug effflux MFS transporter [Pseudaestuariivita atlantica]KNG94485.1 hypothetical protein ATO11_03435 [Pseudaestuariivita atlantica]
MRNGELRLGREALMLGALVAPAPFAVDMFLPALPQISLSLGSGVTSTQMTLTAYFLAFALAHLVYGPWSDARGRLPVLRVGVLVFLVGSVICTLAPAIEVLIFGRVLQATGAAALTVLPRAMIRDSHIGLDATRLTALLMLILSVSPLLAPLAGSLLMMVSDWRGIFAALAAGAIVSYLLLRLGMRETLPPIERYPVSRKALRKGARRLFADPTFLGMTCLASFGLANFFVFVAMAPFVFKSAFGLGHLGISAALAVNGIGFFITAQAAAPLALRFGADRVMLWGALGYGGVVAVTALFLQAAEPGLIPVVGLIALANASLGVTVPTALCRALDPHGPIAGLAASVSGAVQMSVTGLLILGASVVLPQTLDGLLAALAICATLVGVTALCTLRTGAHRQGWTDGYDT